MTAPRTAALVALLLLPAAGAAQSPRVAVRDAAVGLPPARPATGEAPAGPVVKRNGWAPLRVQLEVLQEFREPLQLLVESSDADGLKTRVAFPLGSVDGRKPGEILGPADFRSAPAVRVTDGAAGSVVLTVLTEPVDGSEPRPVSEPRRLDYFRVRDAGTYVVLGLGSPLPGFDLPRDESAAAGPPRNGRVELATYSAVSDLPDQWFAYGAADLAVLPSGSSGAAFASALFAPTGDAARLRRDALLEWVRRGGKLLVTGGANAGALAQLPALQELMPAKLPAGGPVKNLTELPLKWQIFGGRPQNEVLRARAEPFAVARVLAPKASARVLIPRPEDRENLEPEVAELPVAVQAPFGLGKVTFVAFDLESPAFQEFAARPAFWDWLLRTAGAERAGAEGDAPADAPGRDDALAGDLRARLDQFEGVNVISFGWVAVFIALYALLIGPVEYLFLKKVVGRLELTWITFPLIVAGVSAAAYFAAYAAKGKELRVNKVDVVDVDPASGRAYGASWFALFSPRIDNYTVGVTPREGWSPGGRTAGPPLVDWLGGTGGAGAILGRGYRYHARPSAGAVADALEDVPVQVWSTKAFTARWSAPLDPAAPLVESRLYHPPGDPEALAGSFVSRLPAAGLRDAVLVYAGRVYKLGALTPGQAVTPVRDAATEDPDWFPRNAKLDALARGAAGGPGAPSGASLWGALFHERALSREYRSLLNGSLRDLDQSWRVSDRPESTYRGEALLLARADAFGPAEELLTAPDGASASTLWLKALPGGGAKRPEVPGTLRQELYVRAFLPVAAGPAR